MPWLIALVPYSFPQTPKRKHLRILQSKPPKAAGILEDILCIKLKNCPVRKNEKVGQEVRLLVQLQNFDDHLSAKGIIIKPTQHARKGFIYAFSR